MNHCFIIQVHQLPELLERTIKRLYADNHFFYIHIDTKNFDFFRSHSVYSRIKELANVRYIGSAVNVEWGGIRR